MSALSSYVAGRWVPAGSGYLVTSPATGEVVAEVTNATPGDLDRAVRAARVTWERTRWAPLRERAGWCEAVADVLAGRAARLAEDLAVEHGKPLAEASAEVAAGIRGFRLAAEEARRASVAPPLPEDPGKRVAVIRQPRGVWAVLTPWNFPFNIPIEYLGPAVATGSPVLWKPAPTTARIASHLLAAIVDAGVPDGLVQLLLTDSVDLAAALVRHPGVDAVGLTGGAATGRAVAQAAWDKHLLLELGGNGPVIVLDDADLSVAVPAVASSAFTNAGQVCSAAGRILAAGTIADELTAGLEAEAHGRTLGLPLDPATTMGVTHTAGVAATTLRHTEDAVARGARLVTGGVVRDGAPTGRWVEPTVLDHVPAEAALVTEETFGPIAPVVRLGSDEEILAIANSGRFGLTAAVFTSSLRRAYTFAERLESGTVVVNDESNYWELHLPFGGWSGKESGRGRIGGAATFAEFTQLKTVSVHVGAVRPGGGRGDARE
jgi:succinate-semialdehyde dehydrogenase/glutarate-semialdehyde dehydrogenase